MDSQNTSGQGAGAVVPPEIQGKWNWGAFLLNWIWAIGNQVWIGLLALVLGWIMAIVLGIKGNDWAWQNRKWESVEQFKQVQSAWTKWGVVIFILSVVLSIILWVTVFAAMMMHPGSHMPTTYPPSGFIP
jgi:hypothetical protein